MTVVNPDPLLSRAEAAYLGLKNPNTLAVWASRKSYRLPYILVGSAARYRKSALDKFLEERTVCPGGEEVVSADPEESYRMQ